MMVEIVHREEMAGGTVVLNEIMAPRIARKARPGQFVILQADETGERIPMTIADTSPEKGTITVVYQVAGKSTARFRELQKGDHFEAVIGPLGKATHFEKQGTVVCIGGGTAVAALHPITRALKELGNNVIAIIGARTKDLLILEQRMQEASHQLHVCTDDGSYGREGFVTDALRDVLEKEDVKFVVAIGPVPMMKFVCQITAEYHVKTLVSLNPVMVDGTGMCGCCRVTVGGKTRFACVDGPEFDGHQVDFDELAQRLSGYRDEERRAYEMYNHKCRLV